jgi:signal transduction histidine kinase
VVLGLAGDFEPELQFAHRFARQLRHVRVVLLAPAGGETRARALFDTLDAVVLTYPPEAARLRSLVCEGPPIREREPLALSQRPARDALADRFARWFGDIELPDLLQILDPQLAGVPLLIEGEPGTGRGLLARYLHAFGSGGALVHAVCIEGLSPEALLDQIAAVDARFDAAPPHCTIWLEDIDQLPRVAQQRVRGWIEFGLPAGVLRVADVRWVGTSSDTAPTLSGALRSALSGFALRIPPLRERSAAISTLVATGAQSWCARRGERPRSFAADARAILTEYPWPGNLRELDAVIARSLITSASDPVPATALRHEDAAFAPAPADDPGVVLVEDDADETLLETFLEEEFEPVALAVAGDSAAPEAANALRSAAVPGPPRTPTGGPATTPRPPATPTEPAETTGVSLRRWVGAISHELRNPLTTIRTFAELFPDQHRDPEFRENFAELVGRGVDRIEAVVTELSDLTALAAPATEPVDVAGLLEELLELRRETIHARRLVVLKELDKARPLALGDAVQLRFAFDGLLRKCLEIVPERGDVYFASRHHETGLRGGPALRVLVRFHGSGSRGHAPSGLSMAENALEFLVAETVVRAQGGAFAIQTAEADETLLVLDLPAPA